MPTIFVSAVDLPADPASLLHDADRLLVEDFSIAAGMLARSALEAHLKLLCQQHGCEPPLKELRRSCKEAYLGHLKRAGILDRAGELEGTRLFELGSRIIHCEVLDTVSIDTLLQDVRRFVETVGNRGDL